MKIFISVWHYEDYENEVDISFHLVGCGENRKYDTDYFVTVVENTISLSSRFSPNPEIDNISGQTTPKFYRKIGKIIYKHRVFYKQILKDYSEL